MNDGMMDDDAFDRMVNESYSKAAQLDPSLADGADYDIGPNWRAMMHTTAGAFSEDTFDRGSTRLAGSEWSQGTLHAGPGPALNLRMPQPGGDDSWVVLRMFPHEARLLQDGVERAGAGYTARKGDAVSMTSYPMPGGARFVVTVRGQDQDEAESPKLLLRWFRYDPPAAAAVRRPWWRRWLDRAWPKRGTA